MQQLGEIDLLKGDVECLHSLPYAYSSGIGMNHDITDEVMLGVILVDVRVLKQRIFVTGKRMIKVGGMVSVTIFGVL